MKDLLNANGNKLFIEKVDLNSRLKLIDEDQLKNIRYILERPLKTDEDWIQFAREYEGWPKNDQLENKKDLICKAISERKTIQFQYTDGVYAVHPICCGIDTHNDYVLRGVQLQNRALHTKTEWRLFRLLNMKKLSITKDRFTRKWMDYDPKEDAMLEVFDCLPLKSFLPRADSHAKLSRLI